MRNEGMVGSFVFSPDGRYLVGCREGQAPLTATILAFDLETDVAVEIGEGRDMRGTPAWLPDSSGFVFSSNESQEFCGLFLYDLASEQSYTICATEADVVWLEPTSASSGLVVLHVDAADRLYKYSGEQTLVEVPLPGRGVITSYVPPPMLTADGRYCTFNLTSPVDSGSVWRCDLETGDSVRLSSNSGAVPIETLAVPSRHRVRSFDGVEAPVSLYRMPCLEEAGGDSQQGWPALVCLHGGPEDNIRLGYEPRTQTLVNRGYSVAPWECFQNVHRCPSVSRSGGRTKGGVHQRPLKSAHV